MRSKTAGQIDKPIELILRTSPSAFTDLFDMTGREVKFSHVQIKQAELRPDGLIVVDGKEPYIFEFQAQPDNQIFDRAYFESTIYTYQNRDKIDDVCGALIVFANRRCVPKNATHWSKYFNHTAFPKHRYICLEDFFDEPGVWQALFLAAGVRDRDTLKKKLPECWQKVESEKEKGNVREDVYANLRNSVILLLGSTFNIRTINEFNELMGLQIDIEKVPYFNEILTKSFIKGEAKGMEKGREIGKDQGKREILLSQLAAKFGKVPASVTRKIQSVKNGELETVSQKILTAKRIEDILN